MVNRDGTLSSLWQDTVPPYVGKNSAEKTVAYDLVIVGGGITGLTTGLLLQKAGKQCLVLEAANLGFGTTGGTTAHLNTLLDTPYTTISKNFDKESARLVANATRDSIELVRANVANYNIDCGFSMADAYLIAQNDNQEKELAGIAEASMEAGLDIQYSEVIPVPVPFLKAIRVAGQAKFHPLKYLHGIASAFENAGGAILQHCRVTGVENNDMVEVETTQGRFTAKNLVYATHIPPGVNLLHLRCVPYRSYAMAVTLEGDMYPDDLAYDMYDPYHYYRSQEVNGKKFFVAGGFDHKTGHEDNTENCFRQLENHIRKYFPVTDIAYKWSSQYYEPADGLPYIGHLPGQAESIFVATGYGGNGMTYSGVAALTLKEILLNEETRYSGLFNPNRIKPVAGFANFIRHNADVARLFVGKWFSGDTLHEFVELAPGDGKVVSFEGRKVAVYKDDEGMLHAVNPICKHLKCEVKWNGAERSWDCPCHGARYSFDGRVITGPADSDLEAIRLESLIEK